MPERHDQVSDPRVRLGLEHARRGTALFSRKLAELTDDLLAEPSLVAGWSRAQVVARVGYQGRSLAVALEEERTGVPGEAPATRWLDEDAIAFAATLPPLALRHLHAHAAVHINVEWRDRPDADWLTAVEVGGVQLQVADTPWVRAREVWSAAVALGNGARLDQVPLDCRAPWPPHAAPVLAGTI